MDIYVFVYLFMYLFISEAVTKMINYDYLDINMLVVKLKHVLGNVLILSLSCPRPCPVLSPSLSCP